MASLRRRSWRRDRARSFWRFGAGPVLMREYGFTVETSASGPWPCSKNAQRLIHRNASVSLPIMEDLSRSNI